MGPRLWTKDFVVGTLTNFAISANYFMLMVVMTAYAMDEYSASASVAAFCASVFIIGTLVARFTSALLLARMPKKLLLLIGTLFEVGLTALYLLHEALPLLVGLRFLHGFAFGTCSTVVTTIVTGLVPAERKGEGIGYFMLSVTLGAAIGPFAGIFLSNNVGYLTLFAVAVGVAAVSVPCTLAIASPDKKPEKPKADSLAARLRRAEEAEAVAEEEVAAAVIDAPRESTREDREAVREDAKAAAAAPRARDATAAAARTTATTRAAAAPSARGATTAAAHTTATTTASPTAGSALHRFGERVQASPLGRFIEVGVMPISVVGSIVFFGYSSLLTFLTPYATEIGLARAASVFFIVYAISMFVTRPFTGRAFDRRGPMPVMVPAFVSFALGMVVLALASNDWMILGAALLLGFGVGTVQSCGLAIAVRATPDTRLNLANATFYIMLDIGVGVGPVLLGALAPAIGYSAMYLCMAGVGALALVLFLIICRPKRANA